MSDENTRILYTHELKKLEEALDRGEDTNGFFPQKEAYQPERNRNNYFNIELKSPREHLDELNKMVDEEKENYQLREQRTRKACEQSTLCK